MQKFTQAKVTDHEIALFKVARGRSMDMDQLLKSAQPSEQGFMDRANEGSLAKVRSSQKEPNSLIKLYV